MDKFVRANNSGKRQVQCVIDMCGPTDQRQGPQSQLFCAAPAERPRAAAAASLHVDPSDPPFFVLYGTKDPLVPYQDSVNLNRSLKAAGVPVYFPTIDGGGHGDFPAAWPEIERRITAFLERKFYDRAVPVSIDTLVP